ncbi:uncharacterized protein [Panulirus ornatus]|uniref:uncharacterized protein n=1 Tax=Panulirus ornatus TaxID=150431 RepID=UPI003A838820
MGNGCCKGQRRSSTNSNDVIAIKETEEEIGDAGTGNSAVVQWEQRQKELNLLVLNRMRDDFHNRPDNFLLNLLVVSIQFYKNFGKEKADISNHIRDREQALGRKLTSSKRKIIYLGGFEEISGTHILYQPKMELYMELPTPLQIYVVQDNVEVYAEDQYEELQKRNYADVDGPAYRFCTETSQRHKGYVRLRCADIIPGVSRHNTYEDIYGYMKPSDESLPDPVVDVRPLRRNSQALYSDDDDPIPKRMDRSYMRSISSEFEDTDDDDEPIHNLPPSKMLSARRPSGVLPERYPTGKLKESINVIRSGAEGHLQNGYPGARMSDEMSRPRILRERRPSGVFPKVGPNMERLQLASKQQHLVNSNGMAAVIQKLARVEEGSEEEEEGLTIVMQKLALVEDEVENKQKNNYLNVLQNKSENETVNELEKETEKSKEICLSAHINEDCFLNRKIKIKDHKDAYGIATKSERRTYFSSERYLECFEDEFEELAKILGKEHLVDTCEMQVPAVLAHELMIEQVGPKFNIEFIPTMIVKEWPSCAFEWKLRERRARADPETKMTYRWPKEQSIQESIQMGCNLVPIGHYNPKEPNRVMKIEWQIQFAKAEQILLRSLGHTQIRLLLLVEFLMRDHLGDITGLKTQHFRYILFWMCEHNFKDWQEERLGIKLKTFFKTLYNCLSTENLPHYFVDKCNMIETIPERYLRQIQARVRSMKDNLPIYLMHTMRRMRTDADFFPELNILELYKLVTRKTYSLQELNPQLLQLGGGEDTPSEQNMFDDGEDVLYSDSEEEREHRNMKEKLHALRKKRKKAATKASSDDSNKNQRQQSTIRLKNKVQSVKDLRAGRLLSIFADHFIGMARASNMYRSYPQAYMYLLLAGNMATLLEETGNFDDAQDFKREIEKLNVASRSGVQDVLGSLRNAPDTYDLMLGNPNLHSSNWELRKEHQPLPHPPKSDPSIFGVDQIPQARLTQGSSLTQFEENTKAGISQTFSTGSEDTSWQPTLSDCLQSRTSPTVQKSDAILVFTDDDEESTDF